MVEVGTGGLINTENRTVYVNALKNISFSLGPGDSLGLIGHNGSGKSSLLRVLAGIYHPSTGAVHSNGRISGILNISAAIESEATGYENIKIKGILHGVSKKEIKNCIKDVEEFTDMGSFLSLPVRTYSDGMKIRLAFAISTMIKPEILLLDEGIGAGDAAFMHKAKERLNQVVQNAEIMVLASHSCSVLKEFCNKCMWLHHGEVKAFGEIRPVLDAYDTWVANNTATVKPVTAPTVANML